MITNTQINELFGIKESFELPQKLLEILFNKELKNKLCDDFLKYDIDLTHDIMRDYFQEQHSNRNDLKQDYTPDCLCNLLFQLAPQANNILDVCAGTGAISINFLNNKDNINEYQLEELSARSIPVLLFNLIIRNVNAIVYHKNVLTKEINHIYKLTKNEKYSDIEEISKVEENKFDLIVSNPPYSLNWEPKKDERFDDYELAPKNKADYAFVLDILSRLSDTGKAFIVLPTGVLFRSGSEGAIRQKLIENNLIDTIIGLPDKLFLNTGIPVLILVLNKNKKDNNILFINSDKNFQKGKKQNHLNDVNISKIVEVYKQRGNIEKFSRLVTFEEIKNNDFNLNIPRYVFTNEEEKLKPISETLNELIETEKEINKITLELSKTINEELVGTTIEAQKDLDELKLRYKLLETFQNTNAMDSLCEEINNLSKNINMNCCNFKLKQLATIERAIKGKIYKKGCTILQISASNGQFIYLDKDSNVEAKYAVIIPNPDINSKYLYFSIKSNLEKYLLKVQQDLNITLESLFELPVIFHIDKISQMKIAAIFETIEKIEKLLQTIEELKKEEKKYLLKNMFC